MRRFPHGVADVNDFMSSLAQGSGRPEIVPAFQTFLNQPGVPLVRVKSACQGRDLTVELGQSAFGSEDVQDKRLWSVPVCMRDVAKGRALGCTMVSTRSATATFKNQCGAVVMPNADGAGYYRFSMSRDEWRDLAARAGKLPPAEQLALLHSLRAAFRSGDAEATTYVAAVEAVVANTPWDVLDTIQKHLTEMRGDLLARADVPLFEQRLRALIAPLIARVGLAPKRGERPTTALLRAKLAEIAVKVARDPSTMSALAATGAAHLRAVARAEPEGALPPPAELVPVALWAALFTGGEPVARDAMAAIKASSEAEFRLAAITALTAARDAKAVAEIEEFVAAGALRVREARFYLRDVFADAERRSGAWAWLRKDFKRLTDPVPKDSHGRFVALPSTLCTDSAHAEIEWFFKPMVDELMGAPRLFANTLETVDRCVAWRKAKGSELAAALRAPR
jgi:alanyl aminopeptidase